MIGKVISCGLVLALASPAAAEVVRFKQSCLGDLVAQIPEILASQDRTTGRFGTGIWIVTDQNVLLPLAAAWSYRDNRNPYYHDGKVLAAIMSGGDALIDAQDKDGAWVFRKKDGSTWGKIYMPWTYARWIRAFALIRESMPDVRRIRWERALRLGFSGIKRSLPSNDIKNIPSEHAAALYLAGVVFREPEWGDAAAGYLHKVIEAQNPDGYWSEHSGPVVQYGFVYMEALGMYLAASGDEAVRPALRKAAVFLSHFTYPNGSLVETVDERNPYDKHVEMPNLGFTFSPEGRAYYVRQRSLIKGRINADTAASLLLSGEEGETPASTVSDYDYVLPSGEAMVRRRAPWLLAVSAMTAPVSQSRWIQDRQNFVSIYRDGWGLIVGGGNTKLQPGWSNFTAGNMNSWFHKPGDEKPDFAPPSQLTHIPSSAKLLTGDDCGVELNYAGRRAKIVLKILRPDRLEYRYSGDEALSAHITILPHANEALVTAAGGKTALNAEAINIEPGEWMEYAGVRYSLPPGTRARWPVLPHNPYRKDGSATPSEARIVVDSGAGGIHTLVLEAVR